MFDGSILTTAAVSAPSAMLKSVGNVFRSLDDLGDEEGNSCLRHFGSGKQATHR
jgi:hypothetical protein